MRKIKFLLLAVIGLLCSVSVSAHDFEVDGIYYSIISVSKKTVGVTYQGYYYDSYSNEYSGKVKIPESVTYNGNAYSVVGISNSAFNSCSSLTSVEIGNSVTSIGEYAFSGCSSLTSVDIPNSVTSIGKPAFGGCSSLTSVTLNTNKIESWFANIPFIKTIVLGNDVTSIGDKAFSGCSGLTSVVIPESVTSIGASAFYKCTSLTSVEIGNSVTSIGVEAFSYCSSLTSVEIPNSVTSIGNSAFSGCSSLTSVEIPNSVTSIGDYVFSSCSSLTSVVIPDGVTSIGDGAFAYCSSLTSAVIGNGVTRIGDNLFDWCKGLTSITIGRGVTSIGMRAFRYCNSLTSVHIEDVAAWCNIEYEYKSSGVFDEKYSSPFYYAKELYVKGERVTDLIIPDGVTRIGDWAFRFCSGLTSVSIPESVTEIGELAFDGCTGLTSVYIDDIAAWCNIEFAGVTSNPLCYAKNLYLNGKLVTDLVIPNGVPCIHNYAFYNCDCLTSVLIYNNATTSIGGDAFMNCDGLTSVVIGNGVTSIGGGAFMDCSSLTSVDMGNGVTSIGGGAFQDCYRLTSVNIYDIAAWCNIEFAGVTSNPLCYAKNLYLNGKLVTDLVIPNGVPCIHNYAFYNCNCLTSVLIYNNATTSIGDNAFMNCSSLTSVVMGNKVTIIGAGAFSDCSSLTSVDMGNGVTSIGGAAFKDCSRLTSVNIYDIAAWCNIDFYDADSNPSSSANLYLNGKLVTDLVIPHGVSSIKKYAFNNCQSLTSVEIPNTVTSIGVKAFRSCYDLTSVEIPNSVTSIGEDAFIHCDGLISVVIPSSVTSIGVYAFYGCPNLSSIISLLPASKLFPISNNVFGGSTDKTTCTLYVPYSSKDTYASTAGWQEFTNIVEMTPQPFTVDNIKYEVLDSGNEVAIAGFEDEKQTTLMPPEKVTFEGQEYTVTSIGSSAFFNCYSLTSVVIPNSVTSIGDGAFDYCSSLTSVVIPNNVTSIGDYAFRNCSDLTSVVIPNSVTSIGSGAFSGCSGLTSVVIPNNVTSIGSSAFSGCTSLHSLKLPRRMDGNIERYAFARCTQLKEVVLPDTVGRLSDSMFTGCTQLHTVTLPSVFLSTGTSSCHRNAFAGCTNLKCLIMPSPEPLDGFKMFSRTVLNGVSVIVPNGSLETYSADGYWARWPLYEMDQYIFNFVTIPNKINELLTVAHMQMDFADHGLLTSPSQISTNKLEPTEGSIEALLDNDKETYFHSTWSVANESLDNYHFLEVDLGKAVKQFMFNYARRSHGTVSSPELIHVYATNDPNGTWADMGRYTCLLNSNCFEDELWHEVYYPESMRPSVAGGSSTYIHLDDAYRYIRFEVEQSYAPNVGEKSLNNIYFTLSELAIYEGVVILTEEMRQAMLNDIEQIEETAAQFNGTQDMIDTLDAWINRIQEGVATGVDQVAVRPTTTFKGVYSISGKLVKSQCTDLNDLPKGVYIVNGKKVVK